jgi:von Willebrand factor type A domain
MLRRAMRACALACLPFVVPLASADAKPVVEVAFVLDTTGSMGQLIEAAKRKIWSIATSILDSSPDAEVRMGLVAYRDIGDEYVTKTFDLTTDIQDIYAHLLEFKAQGGGDWPESVNEALHVAVTKLAWSGNSRSIAVEPATTRILFLVGDAPPHMDYPQDTKYPEVVKMAQERGIVVNAVQAGGARDTERVWREIAQLGNGQYIPIPQDGGAVVVIDTPYDSDIVALQKRVNATVVPYGSAAQRNSVAQKTAQVGAAAPSSASDMVSFFNKRGKNSTAAEAVTGDGDLVADVAAGRQTLDGLPDETLPTDLRQVEKSDRKAYLDKKLAERNELNQLLSNLVAKRDEYIAAERNKKPVKTGDSFDRAVETTLRAQIQR